MADIKLKQYSYFSVRSQSLSCDEIEEKLGIAADKHQVLGAIMRKRNPPWPLTNSWELICKENVRVDYQIEILVNRLMPAKIPLIELADAQSVEVTLEVVRYFDHKAGQTESLESNGNFQKFSGQHQLLGWNISAEIIAFLSSIKADLDVDEYN